PPSGVDGGPKPVPRPPVERAEAGAHFGVGDDDEAPVLAVPARRRPDGGVEHGRRHLFGHRVGRHPPHGASGVQGFEQVHSRSVGTGRHRSATRSLTAPNRRVALSWSMSLSVSYTDPETTKRRPSGRSTSQFMAVRPTSAPPLK